MPKTMIWAWIRNFIGSEPLLDTNDMGMDQELYRFRAIIGHQGPLLASDPDWKGSKYNVQVEWETGEITFEPLSIIADDDPVPCAAYAKENDLLPLVRNTCNTFLCDRG